MDAKWTPGYKPLFYVSVFVSMNKKKS